MVLAGNIRPVDLVFDYVTETTVAPAPHSYTKFIAWFHLLVTGLLEPT